MNVLLALLTVWFVLAASSVFAQDVNLVPSAGVYTLKASWPPDADMAQVCFFREDDSTVLGCVTAPVTDAASPTGESVTLSGVTIANAGADVSIRAYAEDAAGNRSTNSVNRAVVDFTPPSAPEMLQ